MLTTTPISDRFPIMDAGRGFAILGILWINIYVFGLPFEAMVIPGIWGEQNQLNLMAWGFVDVFVSGVMRGMISMLFGATAILMLQSAERNSTNFSGLDRYFRRLLWLILFGVIHGYVLLWPFDILYVYGVLGLFIFPFRNLSLSKLILLATLMFSASILFTANSLEDQLQDAELSIETLFTEEELQILRKNEPLVENYEELLELPSDHQDQNDITIVPPADPDAPSVYDGLTPEEALDLSYVKMVDRISTDIQIRQDGYWSTFIELSETTFEEQTTEMLSRHFLDVATFFLIGIILLRIGFFTGVLETATYLWITICAYGFGLALGLLPILTFEEASFLEYLSNQFSKYTYDIRRLILGIANFGLLAILIKHKLLTRLVSHLSKCGRMALTLYISQTIICNALFLGTGFGLFGLLEHYELAVAAFVITISQVVFANVYLKFFSKGPLEWILNQLISGQSGRSKLIITPAT